MKSRVFIVEVMGERIGEPGALESGQVMIGADDTDEAKRIALGKFLCWTMATAQVVKRVR